MIQSGDLINNPNLVDNNQYDVVHYIGHTNCLGIKYRRNHLNEYLNCNWSVKTFHPYDKWNIANKPKCLIVSASYGSDKFVDKALELNIPIYYDRTDYWNANPNQERFGHTEDKLLQVADVITCSSRYLADITSNGIRIDNGTTQFNHIEPRRENIAVYIGKEDNKVDASLVAEWKKQYPDYEFVSIGATVEGCRRLNHKPYQEMMRYLCKCKIGLLPLKDTEYCKAQFNLKYWDYKQAGLRVLMNLSYNYEDAIMKWWPDVCEEICKCYPMLH